MRTLFFIINMLVAFILRFHFDSSLAIVVWVLGIVYGVAYAALSGDD